MTAANHAMRRCCVALFGSVLAIVLALCMCLPLTAFAAPDDTTYTIRLYGGNRGTVNAQDMVEWTNVPYGSTVDLGRATVAVTDGKYYVKGARPAGLDNVKDVEYVALADVNGKLTGTAMVTEDADYVIAYGILADRVEYTVRCVDTAGNELAPAQAFIGDVGDMPAMAAPYFENYVPNAYNATFVLTDDPSQNVITFTYARLANGYTTQQNPNGTIDVVTPAGTRVPVVAGPSATVSTANAAAGITVEDAEDVVEPDGTQILTDDGDPLTAPIESLTITDDEVALASADDIAETNASAFAMNNWASIVLVVAAIALLVVAFVLWRRNRADESESR